MNKETKKHNCGEIHPGQEHEEWLAEIESEDSGEEELEELVDYDGSIMSSKIPLNYNKATEVSRSTSDDVEAVSHQKPRGFYFRRYWAESYQGAGLGDNEEIDLMSGDEAIDMFMDDEDGYGLTYDKAVDKALENGKIVNGSKKQLQGKKMRITEKEKIKKIVEKLLSDKNEDDGLTGKEKELHDGGLNKTLQRKWDNLKKALTDNSIDWKEFIKKQL